MEIKWYSYEWIAKSHEYGQMFLSHLSSATLKMYFGVAIFHMVFHNTTERKTYAINHSLWNYLLPELMMLFDICKSFALSSLQWRRWASMLNGRISEENRQIDFHLQRAIKAHFPSKQMLLLHFLSCNSRSSQVISEWDYPFRKWGGMKKGILRLYSMLKACFPTLYQTLMGLVIRLKSMNFLSFSMEGKSFLVSWRNCVLLKIIIAVFFYSLRNQC